ncbi:MAG: Ig-like domain-containing protein, partial [Arachnia sp.]
MPRDTPAADERHHSRGLRLLARFARRTWQGLAVAAVARTMAWAAVLNPGLVEADVHLNEGTVYVANRNAGLVGTLNEQIPALAGAATAGDAQLSVLQEGQSVAIHGMASSTLVAYEPGPNRLGSPTRLPVNAEVSMAGGTVVVSNPDSGRVWFGSLDSVLDLDFQRDAAHLDVGERGLATATSGGGVIGLNTATSSLVRPAVEGQSETALPFELSGGTVQLSAVGDRAVVLDSQAGLIWVEGMPEAFEVSGAADAKLTAPAPDALGGQDEARAIYATQAGLIAVTADGPRSVSGRMDATPVAPVQANDCVYAAFGDSFVRACRDAEPAILDIPEVPEGAQLQFQVNRSTVVLNDVVSGTVWLVDQDMRMILPSDWEEVIGADDDSPTDETRITTVQPPERTEDNRSPTAEDDELAARAGRSTILTVLDNDSDPDGDVLTITAPSEVGDSATVQQVRGGSGLQITLDAGATGQLTFSYTIDDGRGGSDTAMVTLEVLPPDPEAKNSPPQFTEPATPLSVQLGQTITMRALLDWRDPDGDALILLDAVLPEAAEDEVSFTTDGDITFRDVGKSLGAKTIAVSVSDGYATTEAELTLEVVTDVVPPIAFGDYETVTAGEQLTVRPLANDVASNLVLTEVAAGDCACKVTPSYRDGWFTFSAEEPGTYYVTYKVSNGPVAVGIVRIDVRAPTTDQPPVAALDVALLPPGGSVLIDPLLNDTDPDGNVLVVQEVSQPAGLQATLERRHLITISAIHTPTEPITLTYRVSDGKHSVLGTIIVVPTPGTGSTMPQAVRDAVRVRAGSTQAVDVLANDSSPVGLDLAVDRIVENPLDDRAWLDDDQVQVSIPEGAAASTKSLTYEVSDSEGNIASARIAVTVVSQDAQNEPPVPAPVVERVLSGTTTRVAIPLSGIDPNGDAVRVVGVGSGPTLGRVLSTGDGWLTYEAFPGSQGTDVFTYQVIDALGAIGTGEIRVGVAPPGVENSPPIVVSDTIEVRPGRDVAIPALHNDVDIDGDAIGFTEADPVSLPGIDAEVDDQAIMLQAPEEEGVYTGTYIIQDARGRRGSGEVSVVVDKQARLLPPEANDDLVPLASIVGKDWVEVDVLANDIDPDGSHEQLSLAVLGEGDDERSARVAADGKGL